MSGKKFCVEAYAKIAEALYEGGIDGFLLETMNNWEEAEIALEAVKQFHKKASNFNAKIAP